jgi:hypothetical protein
MQKLPKYVQTMLVDYKTMQKLPKYMQKSEVYEAMQKHHVVQKRYVDKRLKMDLTVFFEITNEEGEKLTTDFIRLENQTNQTDFSDEMKEKLQAFLFGTGG